MAGVCSWCWSKQTVPLVLFSMFFLILVDQVTVFVSVGVCAVAGAVSQVSFDLKQVPRGWGINMHIFVFCFSCITQHVEGVGCLHPPVTNKVW